MERRYPAGMFLFGVITNFFFHYFYLFVSGVLLCIVGIWVKVCLWIGLALLAADLGLSTIAQIHIRKAALTTSDNPEFNELMDAFYGPSGPDAFKEIIGKKMRSADPLGVDTEQE